MMETSLLTVALNKLFSSWLEKRHHLQDANKLGEICRHCLHSVLNTVQQSHCPFVRTFVFIARQFMHSVWNYVLCKEGVGHYREAVPNEVEQTVTLDSDGANRHRGIDSGWE